MFDRRIYNQTTRSVSRIEYIRSVCLSHRIHREYISIGHVSVVGALPLKLIYIKSKLTISWHVTRKENVIWVILSTPDSVIYSIFSLSRNTNIISLVYFVAYFAVCEIINFSSITHLSRNFVRDIKIFSLSKNLHENRSSKFYFTDIFILLPPNLSRYNFNN